MFYLFSINLVCSLAGLSYLICFNSDLGILANFNNSSFCGFGSQGFDPFYPFSDFYVYISIIQIIKVEIELKLFI